MVQIQFIKTTKCPICGCDVVASESVDVEFNNGQRASIRRHCNGGAWERRKFACGYTVSYCPNFSKEETTSKCSFDPDEAIKKQCYDSLKQAIKSQIERSDCSEDHKNRLLNSLQYA